jgi:hypothetical protein
VRQKELTQRTINLDNKNSKIALRWYKTANGWVLHVNCTSDKLSYVDDKVSYVLLLAVVTAELDGTVVRLVDHSMGFSVKARNGKFMFCRFLELADQNVADSFGASSGLELKDFKIELMIQGNAMGANPVGRLIPKPLMNPNDPQEAEFSSQMTIASAHTKHSPYESSCTNEEPPTDASDVTKDFTVSFTYTGEDEMTHRARCSDRVTLTSANSYSAFLEGEVDLESNPSIEYPSVYDAEYDSCDDIDWS